MTLDIQTAQLLHANMNKASTRGFQGTMWKMQEVVRCISLVRKSQAVAREILIAACLQTDFGLLFVGFRYEPFGKESAMWLRWGRKRREAA
jgi:hypothetical protein